MSAPPEKRKRSIEELIKEIKELKTEQNENLERFKAMFSSMKEKFELNKRTYSVAFWHESYQDDLDGVAISTFRKWWKAEEEALKTKSSRT